MLISGETLYILIIYLKLWPLCRGEIRVRESMNWFDGCTGQLLNHRSETRRVDMYVDRVAIVWFTTNGRGGGVGGGGFSLYKVCSSHVCKNVREREREGVWFGGEAKGRFYVRERVIYESNLLGCCFFIFFFSLLYFVSLIFDIWINLEIY